MQYVVRRGFSYTDVNGRGQVYKEGEAVNCVIDETQKWKLGEIKIEPELPMATKGVTGATQTQKAKAKTKELKGGPTNLDDPYYDPDDEGEETE